MNMDDIDFERSSMEWMKNKKKLHGGWYAYRCQYMHMNGVQCKKVVEESKSKRKYSIREDWIARSVSRDPHRFCWQHRISGPIKNGSQPFTQNIPIQSDI